MKDSVKPASIYHLFLMAQGTGAWQHFNYYIETYTDMSKLANQDDTDNVSSLYCMVNKEAIVKTLAFDIFGINLDIIDGKEEGVMRK